MTKESTANAASILSSIGGSHGYQLSGVAIGEAVAIAVDADGLTEMEGRGVAGAPTDGVGTGSVAAL